MAPDLLGQLVVLALIDSTSFGTLLIPVWFLLVPGRVRARRVLVFLGTVATFYLVVGLVLMSGARAALGSGSGLREGTAGSVVQLVLGGALLLWALAYRTPRADADGSGSAGGADGAGPGGVSGGPATATRRQGRLTRWRDRAMSGEAGGVGALVGLAVAAAAVELGSMLPYLGAIRLLTGSDLTWAERATVLVGYCLVMVLPALVLLAGRLVAARAVEPLLGRVARWMERSAGETTAWVLGIVGFLLARDALTRLPWVLDALRTAGSVVGIGD
ncbi:GAP family protein [Cellulomonas sp. NS3]|uniref:GAP family protein n=1 Tax=Cellulomonas sp. NS3 TaxID=2973977 RepID=UPI00216259FB|nr:GAP family protein [Cellulomonas sp. NS3]